MTQEKLLTEVERLLELVDDGPGFAPDSVDPKANRLFNSIAENASEAFPLSPFIDGHKDSADPADDFTMHNEALIRFLDHTPYRRLAAHITRTLVLQYTIKGYNLVYLDYLSYNVFDFRNCIGERPSKTFDEYIDHSLIQLTRIEAHERQGHEQGLNSEEIAVHDFLQNGKISGTSLLIEYFDPNSIQAARQIADLANRKDDTAPDLETYLNEIIQLKNQLVDTLNLPHVEGSFCDGYLLQYYERKFDELYSSDTTC